MGTEIFKIEEELTEKMKPKVANPLKVFTWLEWLKVHVSSTSSYSFLPIEMKRGRKAPVFAV